MCGMQKEVQLSASTSWPLLKSAPLKVVTGGPRIAAARSGRP